MDRSMNACKATLHNILRLVFREIIFYASVICLTVMADDFHYSLSLKQVKKVSARTHKRLNLRCNLYAALLLK